VKLRQRSSVPDPKLLITDPDPQIENQELWIQIRIQRPRDDERKVFNFAIYEDTNWLKSSTF